MYCCRSLKDPKGPSRPYGTQKRKAAPKGGQCPNRHCNACSVPQHNRRRKTMARRCRVVLIEDNDLVLSAVGEAILIEGYEVELVPPPADRVEHIDFSNFDVAIIDLTLPRGLDGFGAAQRAADF